jgi:Tol biopolymer transport system component
VRRLPGWAWLPVGLTLGLAAARIALAPRIVERWPAPSSTVPATSEIRIAFSREMDQANVASHLHIEPTQDGEILWQGSTLIFRPSPAWPSGSTVEVLLDSGARSRRGLSTWTNARWTFSVAEPRLVYLSPADGTAQVIARSADEGQAEPLTAAPRGVTDFSLGARGTRLAYTTEGDGGTTELREFDLVRYRDRLLFACPADERCTSPVLSPDGAALAFVRTPVSSKAGGTFQPELTRVWLLNEASGTPVPVSPEGDVASAPFWSPQGWLAFADSTRSAILVVDPARGMPYDPMAVLPSRMGERGGWSPDGSSLIYPDLLLPREESLADPEADAGLPAPEAHLFRWDVSSGSLTDLSAASGVQSEDTSPMFNPQGDWVVFSRRLLSASGWTPGRQLWRMRPDGSKAAPLTDAPFINHGAPTISPTGTTLAYLRFDLEAPLEPAQIWWFDLETQRESRAVEGGYLPAWIP